MFKKSLILLSLASSVMAQIPFGDTPYVIDLSSSERDNYIYEKDSYGRLQNSQWYELNWYKLQTDFKIDIDKYIEFYNGQTFNEAKINYYSQFDFSKEERFHLTDTRPLREWGFLNHPPLLEKLDNLSKFSKNYHQIDYKNLNHRFFAESFNKKMDKVSKSELSFGNKIEVLENTNSYQRKLSLIKNAKDEILMSSLSFVCDSSVKVLVSELIKAKNRGVEVYAMDDSMMSKLLGHSECPKRLKKAGVQFIRANDFWRHEGRTVYHHKKLIIDGEIAIVGGQNQLNADNLSRGTDFKNKDIDILIEGPMVTDIAIGFLKDWQYFKKKKTRPIRDHKRRIVRYTGKDIHNLSQKLSMYEAKRDEERLLQKRGQEYYREILNDSDRRMKGVCRFIQQSPYENQRNIGEAYLLALDNTKNYLGIMDPIRTDTYYPSVFKDAPFIEKLDSFKMFNKLHFKVKALQERGLPVDFITTGTDMTGNEIIDFKNQEIRKLLEDYNLSEKKRNKKVNKKVKSIEKWNDYFGVAHFNNLINDYAKYDTTNVWLHLSFLHSKVFYFDRILSSIGSYNFQHNATDHSYENTILCLDEQLNKELDEVFVRDMANSVPLKFNKIK